MLRIHSSYLSIEVLYYMMSRLQTLGYNDSHAGFHEDYISLADRITRFAGKYSAKPRNAFTPGANGCARPRRTLVAVMMAQGHRQSR